MQNKFLKLTLTYSLLLAATDFVSVTPVWANTAKTAKNSKNAKKKSPGIATKASPVKAQESGKKDRFTDLSGLSKEVSKKPVAENGVGKKRTSFQKSNTGPKGLLNVDSQEIISTLKSINLLLSKNPTPAERIKLLMNRSVSAFSLARNRLLDSPTKSLDKTGLKLIAESQKDAGEVANTPGIPAQTKSRALYIIGLGYINLDKPSEARNRFIEAINVDPKSENTGWMALAVAEDLFEKEMYREAIPYYSNYWAQMDPKEVEISKYKLAWVYLNLENPARTKSLFIELIKNNPKEGFGKDSIRDLAYVVTTYSSEAEIMRISADVFSKLETGLD